MCLTTSKFVHSTLLQVTYECKEKSIRRSMGQFCQNAMNSYEDCILTLDFTPLRLYNHLCKVNVTVLVKG